MKTKQTIGPNSEEITSYGNFALLFTELSSFMYKTFNACHEAEKGALEELRRSKRNNLLNFIGFILMPICLCVLQYFVYIKSNSIIQMFENLLVVLVVIGCFKYYLKTTKKIKIETSNIKLNLEKINDTYKRVLIAVEDDFISFLEKEFSEISCFKDLEGVELTEFVGILDTLEVDMMVVATAFRHSSFLNINEQINNDDLRLSAKYKFKEDFKIFHNKAS